MNAATNTQSQRSWLQRNTKWLVLGAVALGVTLMACFVAAILLIVGASMRSSEVYTTALARAQASPAVIAALGEPIEPGLMPTGSINVANGNGHADLDISISGPNGAATIEVQARKRDGAWTYERMRVHGDGMAAVDLLE